MIISNLYLTKLKVDTLIKPIVFNALIWITLRQPHKRLGVIAMLTDYLNHQEEQDGNWDFEGEVMQLKVILI